jgi:hypothetical protein
MNDDMLDDPIAAGIQSLQYGDASSPEDRAKIQRMLRSEAANAQQAQKEADELARSHAALAKWRW